MRHFFRLIHIFWILLRNKIKYSRGVALRISLEELGPVFIKFGQALSTRQDVLPKDVVIELAKLQDQVPPFSGQLAKTRLEKIYHAPLENIFAEFDTTPLASASVAQVHAATLKNGQKVAVKILRPKAHKIIKRDIALMYAMAKLGGFSKKIKRFKPKELIAEFQESILGELDLLQEAANASQLRRNFEHSPLLYIPKIYWEYTHHNVIVMERIHGTPIREMSGQKTAEELIEIFFTQVFRDNFFHADMHPGNLFVSDTQQVIAVDFGIMGSLSPTDQRYIAENFLAFFKRDYRRVAVLHVESGWAPVNTRVDLLETAIRTVCEPIFERPLGEISFGQLLLRLFQMAARFDINIQPQLILLQKTLLSVEGLARQLYPQLDLWTTAKPYLERWMKTQVGPRAFIRKVVEYAPLWLEQLPEWPNLVYCILQELKNSKDSAVHD